MVKGINKQIIVVNCGGDVFEQAIFILKPQKQNNKTIINEALKIIKEKTSFYTNKKTRKASKRFDILSKYKEDY